MPALRWLCWTMTNESLTYVPGTGYGYGYTSIIRQSALSFGRHRPETSLVVLLLWWVAT